MPIVTQAEFEAGSQAGIAFLDGDVLQVTLPNGMVQTVIWDGVVGINSEDDIRPLTTKEFRDRFSISIKNKLDDLQNNIENDTVFLALCPNVDTTTLTLYRNAVRTAFVDLYSSDGIVLDDVNVVDGIGLLVTIGVILQSDSDIVLDVTTL